jgi:hypothetical protein
MGFLRRLLGGGDRATPNEPDETSSDATPGADPDEERAHEHALLKGEAERLDELQQRQLRYEKYAWQPPSQGGERRADDADMPPSR